MIFLGLGIGWSHLGTGDVVPFQVVVLKKHLPMGLAMRQALWLFKVGEVLVVSENRDWVGGAGKVLVPFRKSMYDGKEFAIIDAVVAFHRGKGFQEIGAGM